MLKQQSHPPKAPQPRFREFRAEAGAPIIRRDEIAYAVENEPVAPPPTSLDRIRARSTTVSPTARGRTRGTCRTVERVRQRTATDDGPAPDRPAPPPQRGVRGSPPGKWSGPDVAPCEPPRNRRRSTPRADDQHTAPVSGSAAVLDDSPKRVRRPAVRRWSSTRVAPGRHGAGAELANVSQRLTGERKTIEEYVRLIEDLFLIDRSPAWGKTLRTRAAASPKVHVIDSGVAARLMRVSLAKPATLDPTPGGVRPSARDIRRR
jgi:hypothetical protein